MDKKIIVKISEGLGNQFFMYANALSLSKKFNFDLYIDNLSGYYKKKDIRSYLLNYFKLSAQPAHEKFIYNGLYRNFIKKIKVKMDFFYTYKNFLNEHKNLNKETFYKAINLDNLNNIFYLDGNFESEKYFLEYKNHLINEFTLKSLDLIKDNPFKKIIDAENVVSICVRQNRFSERKNKNNANILRSKNFVKDTIDYVNRAISLIETKVENPKYLIWSDDFNGLRNYFPASKFTFVENINNKTLSDFALFSNCKYFIVGPTSFHWWGAWLSQYDDKICTFPKNINPSNNIDYWPENWIPI